MRNRAHARKNPGEAYVVEWRIQLSERSLLVFHRSTMMERLMERFDSLETRVFRGFVHFDSIVFHCSIS